MTTYFLNVGYGEAIVITAKNVCIVVDGGSARQEAYAEPGAVRVAAFLEKLGIRRVDLMIATHLHDDHVGGLAEVAEKFPVGEIWCNIAPVGFDLRQAMKYREDVRGNRSDELFLLALDGFDTLVRLARARGILLRSVCMDSPAAKFGDLAVTPLGMDAAQQRATEDRFWRMFSAADAEEFLRLFHENDRQCNETSLAVHVAQQGRGVLLSSDKVGGWEKIAAGRCLRADVLKLTHHGQRGGMPPAMLAAAEPRVMVVCADRARTYDSAHPQLLAEARAYLAAKGCEPLVYVTGELTTREGKPAGALKIEMPPETDAIRIEALEG